MKFLCTKTAETISNFCFITIFFITHMMTFLLTNAMLRYLLLSEKEKVRNDRQKQIQEHTREKEKVRNKI